MKIKGLGGTDFRLVFKRVDEMIHNKEFFNLKGLICNTRFSAVIVCRRAGL